MLCLKRTKDRKRLTSEVNRAESESKPDKAMAHAKLNAGHDPSRCRLVCIVHLPSVCCLLRLLPDTTKPNQVQKKKEKRSCIILNRLVRARTTSRRRCAASDRINNLAFTYCSDHMCSYFTFTQPLPVCIPVSRCTYICLYVHKYTYGT